MLVAVAALAATDTIAQQQAPAVLSLDQAIQIALDESPSIKIANMEVQRAEFAKKGSYAMLFPQIGASASYQRTIKKQVMYMGGGDDDDEGGGGMSSMMSGILDPIMYYIDQLYKGTGVPYVPYVPKETTTESSDGGIAVGRWNTFNAGITATMPLVNAQLWKSLAISGESVDLAVEKARTSRLETVNQVKQAYFAVLLAKEAKHVYESVYENAMQNLELTQKKYNASKASELDLARAKTTVANAVPDVFNSENAIYLSLWQLKAIMGIDLETEIDVKDSLLVYSDGMSRIINDNDLTLTNNSALRQLEIQADQLANTIKMQRYGYLPTLSLAFSYSLNAMTNDFKFEEYHWTPYSYVGLSLSIPIFSGGQRSNELNQTKVQANQLSLQRENTERQLRISIRQSLSTMETAVKSHDSALDALESAQKAYDIAAKSYEIGRSTLTDLDAAQLALTQAQLAASTAIYNYLVAKAALESTIGADYTAE